MSEVSRTVRITTIQNVLKDIAPVQEGFPMRGWSIEISMLNSKGKEVTANIFDKVTYHLHPTFVNPTRVIKKPPFKIEEQGWGEFDMIIALHLIGGGERKISHDLNFKENKYISDHPITVPTVKPQLARLLLETGPVPSLDAAAVAGSPIDSPGGEKRKSGAVAESKAKKPKANSTIRVKGGVELEKLALGLTKLTEDNLLTVVQMITDNRTPDMSVKNDVDEGEFTIDLYTFPDGLLKSLWDYVKKNSNIE
ncbi:TATA-binding protein-associated factor [Saccharomycopsis crataegensis]|uniref:TATA-binding protein-associated factor n=1 Tax=Saccharomycopsis crataegensis TaxID=43959 RepID=A0AAV5QR42_9ASCO|nr:TATA-binding protein-associated factor [Saccharomycopsis crataegensis]